jgi:hypothetical protein
MRLAVAKESITGLLNVADDEERMLLSSVQDRIQKLEYREAEKLFAEHLKNNRLA